MRDASKRVVCSVAILLARKPLAPASAGTSSRSKPLGVIVQAAGEKGQMILEAEGTSVYDGDVLPVSGESNLVVETGRSRVYLGAYPSAVLHRLANGFSVNLTSGTLGISTGLGETFEVVADGVRVAPVRDVPTSVKIIWVSSTELELETVKGALRVSMGEQTTSIGEGHFYRVNLLPSALSGAASARREPASAGRNWFTITMISATAIGTGIAVWRAFVSPCKP